MAVHEAIFREVGGSAEGTNPSNVAYKTKLSLRVRADQGDSQRVIYDYLQATSTLPWIGRSFRTPSMSDERIRCNSVNAELIPHGGGWWEVSCEYAQLPGIEGGEDAQGGDQRPGRDGKLTPNPIMWKRDIDLGAYQISVPMEMATFKGFKGGFAGGMNAGGEALRLRPETFCAVMNSAGVPFDPPPEEPYTIRTVRVSQYVEDFSGEMIDYWTNVVNSELVNIAWDWEGYYDSWKPLQAKIFSISATAELINDFFYVWKYTIEVHINGKGWRKQILDRGTERAAGSGDPDGKGGYISLGDIKAGQPLTRAIRDPDGYPTATPVLLDGKGQPLNPGKSPVWLEYTNNIEAPFSQLGF